MAKTERNFVPLALAWALLVVPALLALVAAVAPSPLRLAFPWAAMAAAAIFSAALWQLVAGAVFLVMLATNALTFDFEHEAWPGARTRVGVANLAVQVCLMFGGIGVATVVGTRLLVWLGVASSTAFFAALIVGAFAMFVVTSWVPIWAPVEIRWIVRRMRALRVAETEIARGILIGISNPDHLPRNIVIEEDVGMLWLEDDRMRFVLDGERIEATHTELLRMERIAQKLNSTALAGTRHVVLTIRTPDGGSRRIRLHSEGVLTLGGKRRAADELAARVEKWWKVPTRAGAGLPDPASVPR